MPRIWSETIESHRSQVRDAVLDAAAALAATQGLRNVTMSEIAARSGIGRATLYKYFPDIETILLAWHERMVRQHLAELRHAAGAGATPLDALRSALTQYAVICQHATDPSHPADLVAFVHGSAPLDQPKAELHEFFAGLLSSAVRDGSVRTDTPPAELASYCVSALTAAGDHRSRPATKRLVELTIAGMLAR